MAAGLAAEFISRFVSRRCAYMPAVIDLKAVLRSPSKAAVVPRQMTGGKEVDLIFETLQRRKSERRRERHTISSKCALAGQAEASNAQKEYVIE